MRKCQGLRTYGGGVAIVTGGASGIGRALAGELSRRGARVVIADKNREHAEQAAAAIVRQGGDACAVITDVTDYFSVDFLVRSTVDRWGRIDYMFNNAGIGVAGLARDFQLRHWQKVIDVNLMGVINGVQAVYPVMTGQGFGHIVNTSSMAGLVPFPLNVGYTASKHAVVGLSQALRVESGELGIRVSVVCPGVVKTPILDGQGDSEALYEIAEEVKRKAWKRMFPADAGVFARKVVKKVAANRAVIVVPEWWSAIWLLQRISPAAMEVALRREFYAKAMSDLAPFLPKR